MERKHEKKSIWMLGNITLLLWSCILFHPFFSPTDSQATILFVQANATTGQGTGTSWANAYTNLQDAIVQAGSGDQIWVAAGTYKPNIGKRLFFYDQTLSFSLKQGVALYGGFAGTETTLSERNWVANPTLLSGDIKDNDLALFTNYSDNSYHVVSASGSLIDSSTILDGFTITSGNASLHGGGILLDQAAPSINNCIIKNNAAQGKGGAIYVKSVVTSPKSTPLFTNCIISGNGAASGGAIYTEFSAPTLINCTLINNKATEGGGLYNYDSAPVIANSILWGNSAIMGTQIFQRGNTLDISFSTLAGGREAITSASGPATISRYENMSVADPLLTADGHLIQGSPCIDSADPALGPAIDCDGEARPLGLADQGADEFVDDSDADGLADGWEMKWFGNLDHNGIEDTDSDGLDNRREYQESLTPTAIDTDQDLFADLDEITAGTDPRDRTYFPARMYVNAAATGLKNGTNWNNAFVYLQDALLAARPGTEIWVAADTYLPDRITDMGQGDRKLSFQLKPGVAIYGGFAGSEAFLAERNWQANTTILSGDLNRNDGSAFLHYEDNAFHVVTFAPTTPLSVAILDGVTISHGAAQNTSEAAGSLGGGLYLAAGSPIIRNCRITANIAGKNGGGIYAVSGAPLLTNTIINGNKAENGGGIATYAGNIALTNITINGNTAFAGGGLHLQRGQSFFNNCTIAGNTASQGGGIYAVEAMAAISNSILSGNKAPVTAGPQLYSNENLASSITLASSLIEGGTGNIFKGVAAITSAGNILDAAAMLTTDGHLTAGSPAIDAADPATAAVSDIDGEPRPAGAGFDLGADEWIDSDKDGLADVWERRYTGNLAPTPTADSDGDGLANSAEYAADTNPLQADSDSDGYNDFIEIKRGTDPLDRAVFPGRLYVNLSATGLGNGTTWMDAFTSLQDALAAAKPGFEVWIAAGTYRPDQGEGIVAGNKAVSFQLKEYITLFGGFTGTETDLSQRDWQLHATILSGDLLANDSDLADTRNDNSNHVISATDVSDKTIVDGIVISGGNATALSTAEQSGGGVLLEGAWPLFRNCTFQDNQATSGGAISHSLYLLRLVNCVFTNNTAQTGGAIHSEYGGLVIEGATFADNKATNRGGAITVEYDGDLALVGSTFSNNTAADGGALYLFLRGYQSTESLFLRQGLITINKSTFKGNQAVNAGGAIHATGTTLDLGNTLMSHNRAKDGGAIYSFFTNLTLGNCTMVFNNAAVAGGMLQVKSDAYYAMIATTVITNSILWDNIAPLGPQIAEYNSNLSIDHSDMQGTQTGIYHAVISGERLFQFTDNIDSLPLLTADKHLQFGSPCINAGGPATLTDDCDGESRPAGQAVDIGMDEFIDSDGDKLPDAWELRHGLSPTDNGSGFIDNGGNGDPDRDGNSNIEEYINSTDPRGRTDRDGDGYSVTEGDCDDIDPGINPQAIEICGDGIDNNCDLLIDADPSCIPASCASTTECAANEFCKLPSGLCGGTGTCQPLPTLCAQLESPVCGCDGVTYSSACEAGMKGISIATTGSCPSQALHTYYFPAIKDDDGQGWENYLTVQAKDPIPMDVTIRVYTMAGKLAGTYIYSSTTPGAQSLTLQPNARVALRPSWIAGSAALPLAIEGAVVIETNRPAIASTNVISYSYKGFSIYESAKPRKVHFFPKAYDGPNFFQVYMLVQNIYAQPRNVTVKLFGKTPSSPGHGTSKTVDIPAFGTLKIRPSEIAGGIDFDGSVVVYSNDLIAEDGAGPAIPAMCRYEAGQEALAVYESTVAQPSLSFPVLKDGKYGIQIEYQNYISVVNPNSIDATVEIKLYDKYGNPQGRTGLVTIPAGGKRTWRPSWISGTIAAPLYFEGSAVVVSSIVVVGQTNTIYPGQNAYGTDAFDLFESALPTSILFFPKAFDNLLGSGIGETHRFFNSVYVQNPDTEPKLLKIELFNNNGTANGIRTIPLASNATYVFRPKDFITDTTDSFRGSVKVTEISGRNITGAIKYDLFKGPTGIEPVEAITIYRSMGQ